jgi:hypothetical protein
MCDGSAKGVAKGQHLHECCIFENSKLGRKEEKRRTSNYTALYQVRVGETTHSIAEPNPPRVYPAML